MDAVAGLGFAGSYIADRDKIKKDDGTAGSVRRTRINGDNIYNSRNLRKNRRYLKNVANKRYRNSRYPMETGIIPNYYNQVKAVERDKARAVERGRRRERRERAEDQANIEGFSSGGDSVFSDDSTLGSVGSKGSRKSNNSVDLGDHMAFFKKGNMIQNNDYHQNKIKEEFKDTNEPGFFSQFEELQFDNPSDPVSSNNIPHKTGKYASMNRLENERDLALEGGYSNFSDNGDMTYGVVDRANFTHNNMVPFFKRGAGKGYGPDSIQQKKLDDVKQRKFETFSGTVKDVGYRPKTERRPLFNPQVGLTNIYGMPNFTNYFETRYIPGRERRNEKLMQPVRETPGLNLGYNEISTEGLNNSWRPLPKTVDELRTANNPKISYGSVVIPGLKSVRRPIIPNVAKRRPVTFKENDPRDFVKAQSYYRAPTIYGNVDAPTTNRQMTTRAWYSAANTDATYHKPESLYGQFKVSHKENFKADSARNVTGVGREKNKSNTGNTYYVHPTNRELYGKRNYVNPAGPEYNKERAFDMQTNIPDPTLRDTTQNRTYQAPVNHHQAHKTPAFDMQSNVPDPTLRDTTQYKTWNNPAGPEWQKGIAFDRNSNIPDPTLRNLTQNRTYQGPATHHQGQKTVAFDMKSNIPDPTLRDTTQYKTWNNPAGPEWQKGVAFDRGSNIPDPTLRDTTQYKTYQGPATHHQGQKTVAFDMKSNIPDPTLRDTTQHKTWNNPAGPEWQKGIAFDRTSNIPDPTLRDTTQYKTYQGPATHHQGQKPVAFDMTSNIPDPTLRDLTQKKTWNNPAGPEWQKGVAFDRTSNIPDPTIRDTTQVKTYQGPAGLHQGQKTVAFDRTSNIPDPTLRDLTQNKTYNNPAGPEWQKGVAFDRKSNIPDPTLRDTTQYKTYQAPAGHHQNQKGGYQAAQAGTIAPTTLRQTTQKTAHYRPLGLHQGQRGGYHVAQVGTIAPPTQRQTYQETTQYNPATHHEAQKGGYQVAQDGTIAPPTQRQTYQDKTYQGPLTHHQNQKGGYQAAQAGTIAPTTLRQLTQDKNYQGPVTHHQNQKGGYQAAQAGTIAPPTLRQLTQEKTYQGPTILHEGQKTRGRNDANNSLVNDAKEQAVIIRDGGAPTTSNYDKGPTYDYTMVQMCEPIQINRDIYGDMQGQRPLQCVPTMHTRQANVLPQQSFRFDTCVVDSLKTNPFINNTQHKSVEY